MVKIQFYPIDFDYDKEGNIKIYGKTIDNKRICATDSSIKPYFWVIVNKGNIREIEKIIDSIKIEDGDITYKVIKTEIQDKSFLDKEVQAIKVTVSHPRDIRVIKRAITDANLQKEEIDIKFIKRYLTDKEITPLVLTEAEGNLIKDDNFDVCIKGEIIQKDSEFLNNPKILSIDIEVDSNYMKDNTMEKHPILTIAFFSENFKKVITWKKFEAEKYVEFVDSEQDLIKRFKETINNFKPDYITGYFSDGFDFPYLKARADIYDIKLDINVDKSNIIIKKRENTSSVKIKGIPHLDILKFIRNIMAESLKLDSYTLNEVAKELLKEQKKDIDLTELNAMWVNGTDLHKLIEYNLHDAELTYKLCNKLLPNLNELVKLVDMPIFDICRMSYGQLVENYLIKRAKEFNEIIPNRPTFTKIYERRRDTYKGAFVMEPRPGFYHNLVFFDFKSLYPTIIISKNISPSMLNNKTGHKTPVITDDSGKKVKYYFDYKKEAFIPKVIEDLITRRNRVKEILKKEKSKVLEARSYALKTVANATYGYFGFSGSRFYSKACAESITAFARYHIQDVIKKAKQKQFDVIYADTDSCCVNLQNKTKEQALEFLEEINRELPSLMELELESFYPRGIFVSKKGETQGAKKKYALIDEQGNIKIRGFETVRRDWSLIARETQKKILGLILKEGSHENALKYTKYIIQKLKNKEISLKDTIIITQLKLKLEDYKQIAPHVAVAKKMKEKGIEVKPGSSILFIVTESPGLIRDKARLPEEAKNYDSEYYINNQV
ncbi:MAG: ribonuclease H-like domain-containing protein, partial [Nanoarchaeota archaeon]|nr:ribonuclease H-like domain-containing protein [Nanoarchaeota archaeon]